MPRIIETYRKDKVHGPGHGYGRYVGTPGNPKWVADRGIPLSSELVHSTNNGKPTSIEHEATFLCNSPDVSCHDLIAKNGDVYIILPEDALAWHSGAALSPFTNRYSFGTEMHISQGEKPTAAQIESLAYRVWQRCQKYGIKKERIDTHRAAALPKGRKSDPEGWSDAEFYAWRDGLFMPAELDWDTLWGTHYPYFEGSAIAGTWRDNAAALGPATSDETGDAEGKIWRLFRGGGISFNPGTGKTVVYVPRSNK